MVFYVSEGNELVVTEVLTQQIAYQSLQKFMQERPFVLFGSGTSCAVDTRFGMSALRDHIVTVMSSVEISDIAHSQWEKVVRLLEAECDLESAMNEVQDEDLIHRVINVTADFIASLNWEYSLKIRSGEMVWPALALFERLVAGLSMNNALHVATTNYDLLAEYSLEHAKIPYITGFCGGIGRSLDWKTASRMVVCCEGVNHGKKMKQVPKYAKHIRLYKVHGSLNTFRINNEIIENNEWIYNKPDTIERMIITPGTNKHERIQQNRAELLGEYDRAVASHSAFLFIGFGFNDSQLSNDAIIRKLKDQECPGLIMTRDSNTRIERIIDECKNVWLICKPEDNSGTRIRNGRFNDPLLIENDELWNPCIFVEKILGR